MFVFIQYAFWGINLQKWYDAMNLSGPYSSCSTPLFRGPRTLLMQSDLSLLTTAQCSIVSVAEASLTHFPKRWTHHHPSLTAVLKASTRKPFERACPQFLFSEVSPHCWYAVAVYIGTSGYTVSITFNSQLHKRFLFVPCYDGALFTPSHTTVALYGLGPVLGMGLKA